MPNGSKVSPELGSDHRIVIASHTVSRTHRVDEDHLKITRLSSGLSAICKVGSTASVRVLGR